MSNDEFSNAMDVALNSYSIPSEFGEGSSKLTITLDEFEKSVFLTKAQDEIFLNLYNGKNPYGDYFEATEELRRYLDNLVRTESAPDSTLLLETSLSNPLSKNSKGYSLPSDLAFITLEQIGYSKTPKDCDKDENGGINLGAKVYPVTQDEYARVKDNPFRGPTRYKVLRIDYGERTVELIPADGYEIGSYLVKYLKKPNPIVLINFSSDLEIHGTHTKTECEMDEVLHNLILDRAVALAVQSKTIGANTKNRE